MRLLRGNDKDLLLDNSYIYRWQKKESMGRLHLKGRKTREYRIE